MTDAINVLSLAAAVLAIVIALLTLYVAWRIPHQIMINQQYAQLLSEYRSIEMGDAILAILDFFVNCCEKQTDAIENKYIERYKNEVTYKLPPELYQEPNSENNGKCEYDPKNALHFKRRLVDQFFWLLGDLRYNPDYPIHLSRKQVRRDFSKNEHYLLHILSHMNKAAEKCQLDPSPIDKCSCGCPRSGNSPMDEYRDKLYKESIRWK